MATIFWLRMKRIKENLPILLGMTVMAFALVAIFGSAFTTDYHPVAYVVDLQKSDISSSFLSEIEEYELFDMKITTYEEAVENLKNGKGIAIVILEKEFVQNVNNSISTIKINDTLEYSSLINFLQNQVSKYYNEIQLTNEIKDYLNQEKIVFNEKELTNDVAKNMKNAYKSPVYTNNSKFIDGEEKDKYMLIHYVIGYTLFFSMYTMVFGIGDIVDEKKWFVYHRQLVSSLSNSQIIFGNLLYTFLLGFVQVAGMILLGQYLFGIDWGNNIGAIMIVAAAFVFCVTSLGLFMTSFVKTMQQLGALAPIVLTSTAMIGGCMWPLDIIENKVLLFLAELTPQKWGLITIEKMVVYNYGIDVIIVPVIVLVGMGLVYLALGISRLRRAI